MTDFLHDQFKSDSVKLDRTEGRLISGVERLLEILDRLAPSGRPAPLVICISPEVEKWVAKGHKALVTAAAKNNENPPAALPDLVAIYHYSEQIHRIHGSDSATYRMLVHDAIEYRGRSDLLRSTDRTKNCLAALLRRG